MRKPDRAEIEMLKASNRRLGRPQEELVRIRIMPHHRLDKFTSWASTLPGAKGRPGEHGVDTWIWALRVVADWLDSGLGVAAKSGNADPQNRDGLAEVNATPIPGATLEKEPNANSNLTKPSKRALAAWRAYTIVGTKERVRNNFPISGR
jgi:hypothetical protein